MGGVYVGTKKIIDWMGQTKKLIIFQLKQNGNYECMCEYIMIDSQLIQILLVSSMVVS